MFNLGELKKKNNGLNFLNRRVYSIYIFTSIDQYTVLGCTPNNGYSFKFSPVQLTSTRFILSVCGAAALHTCELAAGRMRTIRLDYVYLVVAPHDIFIYVWNNALVYIYNRNSLIFDIIINTLSELDYNIHV